jgi:hypothetical protein
MKKILKLTILILIIASCQNSENQKSDNLGEQNGSDTSVIRTKKDHPEWNKSIFNIEPIDESISDKSLVNFISKLKSVLNKKDTTQLFKMIDESIVVSYGGGLYGKSEFRNEWKLYEPNASRIWSEMNKLISYGGAWDQDEEFGKHFVIPYYQSDKILGKIDYEFDWYRTAISTIENVKVYKTASPKADVIDSLNYSIVELISNSPKSTFQKIKILDKNLIGYVYSSQINYLSERTIVLVKKGENWKIVAFAPYD